MDYWIYGCVVTTHTFPTSHGTLYFHLGIVKGFGNRVTHLGRSRREILSVVLVEPLKDICFFDTTPKILIKCHFKHDYVLNLLWLYSKKV